MKKFISIVLVIVLVLGVTACGKQETAPQVEKGQEIGIWSLKDIEFSEDVIKEMSEDASGNPEEQAKSLRDMYISFMAGFYFDFDENGTCKQGFYSEEPLDEAVSEPLKYENGLIYVSEEDTVTYTFNKEGNLCIDEDGVIMIFEKVKAVEDIPQTTTYKEAQQLNEQIMNEMEAEAATTPVLEDKIDDVTAKEIALAEAGLTESQVTELEVEYNPDESKYEVSFKADGQEYDYDVDNFGSVTIREVEPDRD